MELETELNCATVRVVYTVEQDEVDCYDHHSGREYTALVPSVTVEAVYFKGIDIQQAISESDWTALEMECQAELQEVVA